MKTRQKSVRVLEIITDDFEEFTNFIKRKGVFLKRFLLTIKTNNEKIKEYLKDKPFEVRFVDKDFDGSDDEFKENVKVVEKIIEVEVEKNKKPKIFDKIIRSGFEIDSDEKLIFLQRINDGAKIYSSAEIEIFAEVYGNVSCDGEYMIVKKAKEGSIIFHNQPLPEIKTLSFISKAGIKELI